MDMNAEEFKRATTDLVIARLFQFSYRYHLTPIFRKSARSNDYS
jgi:hypothetical protein